MVWHAHLGSPLSSVYRIEELDYRHKLHLHDFALCTPAELLVVGDVLSFRCLVLFSWLLFDDHIKSINHFPAILLRNEAFTLLPGCGGAG